MPLSPVFTSEPFQAEDGLRLHGGSWMPEGSVRAHVLLSHGLGEHFERYDHVGAFFAEKGIALHGYDHRGHGQSEGDRVYVHRFNHYVDDFALFHRRISSRYRRKPCFILAHSMGSTIAMRFLMRHPVPLEGAILSGTTLRASSDVSPLLIKVSGLISALLPRIPVITIDSSTISTDPDVVQQYDEDPLVHHGAIPARTAGELNKTFARIQAGFQEIQAPLLILHGKEDNLVEAIGSEMLYEKAASQDKDLKIYEGLRHEILNEPQHQTVLNDMLDWLEARIN